MQGIPRISASNINRSIAFLSKNAPVSKLWGTKPGPKMFCQTIEIKIVNK